MKLGEIAFYGYLFTGAVVIAHEGVVHPVPEAVLAIKYEAPVLVYGLLAVVLYEKMVVSNRLESCKTSDGEDVN